MEIPNALSRKNCTRLVLKIARKTLFTIIAVGVKIIAITGERLNSTSLKQKAGGIFNAGVSQWKRTGGLGGEVASWCD